MGISSLDEIACRLGTDKSTLTRLPSPSDGFPSRPTQGHGYTIFYEYYFKNYRLEKIRLLEIGVLDGRSLATWREYFPHAEIFGLDIDPACKRFEDDRTKIVIGSQADKETLASVRRAVPGGFDIIIDDGSHYTKHIIASFEGLFEHLRPGGVYVIEDLHVLSERYWGKVVYNRGMKLQREVEGNNPKEMISFLQAVRARNDVSELAVHLKKICFIKKKADDLEPVQWERGDRLEELDETARPRWKQFATYALGSLRR
jgi:SAM-dependent methyltransferase